MAPYAFTLSRLYKLHTNQASLINFVHLFLSENAFTPSSLVLKLKKNIKKDLGREFVFTPLLGSSIKCEKFSEQLAIFFLLIRTCACAYRCQELSYVSFWENLACVLNG